MVLEHDLLMMIRLLTLAKKYGVTVPQLCIRYTLQLGAISVPKTGNPEYMNSSGMVTDYTKMFEEEGYYDYCRRRYFGRIFIYDKGNFHLPRQDYEKPYKSRNNGAKQGIVW